MFLQIPLKCLMFNVSVPLNEHSPVWLYIDTIPNPVTPLSVSFHINSVGF